MVLPAQGSISDDSTKSWDTGGLSSLPVFSPLKGKNKLVKLVFASAKLPLLLGRRVGISDIDTKWRGIWGPRGLSIPLTSILVSTKTQSECIEKSIDETVIIFTVAQLDKSLICFGWTHQVGEQERGGLRRPQHPHQITQPPHYIALGRENTHSIVRYF